MKADTIAVGAVKLFAGSGRRWNVNFLNKFVSDRSAARAVSVVNICAFVHRVWLFLHLQSFSRGRPRSFLAVAKEEKKPYNKVDLWESGADTMAAG